MSQWSPIVEQRLLCNTVFTTRHPMWCFEIHLSVQMWLREEVFSNVVLLICFNPSILHTCITTRYLLPLAEYPILMGCPFWISCLPILIIKLHQHKESTYMVLHHKLKCANNTGKTCAICTDIKTTIVYFCKIWDLYTQWRRSTIVHRFWTGHNYMSRHIYVTSRQWRPYPIIATKGSLDISGA